MFMNRGSFAALACLLLAATPALAQHEHDMASQAMAPPPLYSDLGTWTHKITASPDAQTYFDQGLRLYYGFNDAEAIRAFQQASKLDSNCAMAWWGIAASAGPNINFPMDEAGPQTANDANAQANALAA